ncbi:hypothetical protein SOVF_153060 [Spinacia oleracea]|uniref:DUF7812 domain-containing protein n=1 Tax=Spinacia oleracea TaxID=3562 RepID=A0ABM3RD50_SPIOL|nr:uncharacterized protein LOC110799070 [Spinacia oleracea]XP_056693542.1 uncharacterized protein LOC110799070 [Spinacia oleracea]KNA09487.1 hypothetical protein SOVF_153060 [Spinacia oleracea]
MAVQDSFYIVKEKTQLSTLNSLKPILKLLYCSICSSFSDKSDTKNGFQLKFGNTTMLSNILFEELHKRLQSMDIKVGLAVLPVNGNDSAEELLMILRCCVLLVRLHPYDQILIEKLQFGVSLLRRLSFQRILTRSQSNYAGCTESSSLDFNANPSNLYLQQMQEVYLDEVFAERPFMECIGISDSVPSTFHDQAMCPSIQIESVLDIIAAHFLISFSGEDVLQTFMESLVWTNKNVVSSRELSLPVALSLINHPVMMSSSILLRSHLIYLASEVIGICDFTPKSGPNVKCWEGYQYTLFDSVTLYYEHMSKLMTGSCSPGSIVQNPIESHFHSDIHDRIIFMLVDWDNAWRARARNSGIFNKTLSSMEIDAISYIEMNIYLVDETYRDNVCFFLGKLIRELVSVEIDQASLQSFEEMTVHEFYLLASILKLMSCSLLQANRSDKILSCLIAFLKKRDTLPGHGVMSFFAQNKFCLPIEVQNFIVGALKSNLSTCEEFEFMFVHFAGLLSFSIVSGLHILMKGCLFLMLILANSLALELRTESPTCVPSKVSVASSFGTSQKDTLALDLRTEPPTCVPSSSSGTSQKIRVRKTSSHRVASCFRKERQKVLRVINPDDPDLSDEETCNGEKYLRSLNVSQKDIDELADFLVCSPWRDYNARLEYSNKLRHRRAMVRARRLRRKKMQAFGFVRKWKK